MPNNIKPTNRLKHVNLAPLFWACHYFYFFCSPLNVKLIFHPKMCLQYIQSTDVTESPFTAICHQHAFWESIILPG